MVSKNGLRPVLFLGAAVKNQIAITVYTRRNCTLCEEAAEVLSGFQGRYALTIEYCDVDLNPSWRQNYGQEVPVGFLGEKKLFRFRVHAAELTAELDAHLKAQSPSA